MQSRLLFAACAFFASTAMALTFTTHFPTASAPLPQGLLVCAADPNIVYEVAHETLYRSIDGGGTFTTRSDVHRFVAIDPVDPNVLYDTEQGIVRRSDDGGTTWISIRAGLPNFTPTPRKLVVTPKRKLFLASSCYSGHYGGGIFRTDDKGVSWSTNLVGAGTCVGNMGVDPLSERVYPIEEYGYPYPGTFPADQIVASPRNPDFRYAIGFVIHGVNNGETVFLVSSDGGAGWQRVAVDGGPIALALAEESQRLFLVTSTGLFFTDDRAVSWTRVPNAPGGVWSVDIAGTVLYVGTTGGSYRAPLATLGPFTPLGPLPPDPTAVTGLAIDPNNRILYAVGPGAWRSSDRGQHWESIDGGDTRIRVQPAVDGAGDLYALSSPGSDPALWHYATATGTWETLPLTFGVVRQLAASSLRRGVLCAAGARGLFLSNDGGRAWHQVPDIAPDHVAFDPTLPDVIYVGGTTGLFVSTDAGTSWRRLDDVSTYYIAVAPSRPSTLYRISSVSSDPGYPSSIDLQRSNDGGMTWRTLTYPPYGHLVVVDPLNEDSVWLDALMHSIDGGKTWTSDLGGLPERAIGGYVIDRDGTHLHVYLDPSRASGEFDAVLRVERRHAAGR